MMYGTMRQEMEEQIQEAISPALYNYVQEVRGCMRLGRIKEVECEAIAMVRKYIDGWINGDESVGAFLCDEDSNRLFELKKKSADLVGKYREGRAKRSEAYERCSMRK